MNKFLEGEAQIPHIPHVPDIPRQSRRSLFMQEGDPIRPLVQGRMQLAHCSDFQCRHHTGIIAAHCSYVHGKLHSSSSGQESHQGATKEPPGKAPGKPPGKAPRTARARPGEIVFTQLVAQAPQPPAPRSVRRTEWVHDALTNKTTRPARAMRAYACRFTRLKPRALLIITQPGRATWSPVTHSVLDSMKNHRTTLQLSWTGMNTMRRGGGGAT